MATIETLNERLPVITIVGIGLVGGSIALGLKDAGYRGRLIGVGRRQATLDLAVERGCVDEVTTDVESVVARSRLIMLATPLGTFRGLLARIARHDHDGLIISDAGSVKHAVCRDARETLASFERFVPAHPMAGGEQSGPAAARPDLFRGHPCVVTPEAETSREALELITLLWRLLGMTIVRMPAQEHDRQAAAVSHLPHASSVALVGVAEELGGLGIASTGFQDTTRLASSDPTMRSDIMMSNRAAIIEAIDVFMNRLAGLREILDQADGVSLLQALDATKHRRDAWHAATIMLQPGVDE